MNQVTIAIIIFTAIILMTVIHEFAHMMVAKAFGVKVAEFAVGFGQKICSKKIGGTEYSLRILPFGGYCAFSDGIETEEPPVKEKSRILSKLFYHEQKPNVYSLEAYLKTGKDVRFKSHPIKDWIAKQKTLHAEALKRRSEKEPDPIPGTLYGVKSWKRALIFLAGPASNLLLAFVCLAVAGISPITTLKLFGNIIVGFFSSIGNLVSVDITGGGVITASMDMAKLALTTPRIIRTILIISGGLSFLIGLFNLLPIPAIDGFSIIWALAETISKHRFSLRTENKFRFAGMLFIYALMFAACIGDAINIPNYF